MSNNVKEVDEGSMKMNSEYCFKYLYSLNWCPVIIITITMTIITRMKEARSRVIEKKPPMAAISLGTDVDAPWGEKMETSGKYEYQIMRHHVRSFDICLIFKRINIKEMQCSEGTT